MYGSGYVCVVVGMWVCVCGSGYMCVVVGVYGSGYVCVVVGTCVW